MILLLDTSTSTCRFALYDDRFIVDDEWEAGRDLAEGILGYITQQLESTSVTWNDISGIGVYKGPGSFTGLRIGLAVLNTLADDRGIPIVGETGDEWRNRALQRLYDGGNEQVVLPLYGREATITKPRK